MAMAVFEAERDVGMSLCSFIDEIPLQPTPYIGKNCVEGFSNTVVPFMASLLFDRLCNPHEVYQVMLLRSFYSSFMNYTASVEQYDDLSFGDKRTIHKAMQESARQLQAKLEIVVINDKERPEVAYVRDTDDLTKRPRIYLTKRAFEAFETASTLAEAQHALTFLFLVISNEFGRLWPRTVRKLLFRVSRLAKICEKRSDAIKNATPPKDSGDEIEIALCGGLVHLGIQKFTSM
jgi:hypothetical protein